MKTLTIKKSVFQIITFLVHCRNRSNTGKLTPIQSMERILLTECRLIFLFKEITHAQESCCWMGCEKNAAHIIISMVFHGWYKWKINIFFLIWNFTDAGYEFDICYTSVLKRAIRTLWFVLDSIDQMWVPVHRTWRLNERHYGGLTGLNKAETAAKHGEAQVKIWRRSFDTPPPPMGPDHDYYSIISKVRYDIFRANTQTRSFCWHVR